MRAVYCSRSVSVSGEVEGGGGGLATRPALDALACARNTAAIKPRGDTLASTYAWSSSNRDCSASGARNPVLESRKRGQRWGLWGSSVRRQVGGHRGNTSGRICNGGTCQKRALRGSSTRRTSLAHELRSRQVHWQPPLLHRIAIQRLESWPEELRAAGVCPPCPSLAAKACQ